MLLKFLKVFYFYFCFDFQLNILEAQSMWPALSKVSYKKEYDALLGIKVDRPVFSSDVKSLAGKIIQLKGYIIPTDGFKSHTEFVFSAFPYSSCFCGKQDRKQSLKFKLRNQFNILQNRLKSKVS